MQHEIDAYNRRRHSPSRSPNTHGSPAFSPHHNLCPRCGLFSCFFTHIHTMVHVLDDARRRRMPHSNLDSSSFLSTLNFSSPPPSLSWQGTPTPTVGQSITNPCFQTAEGTNLSTRPHDEAKYKSQRGKEEHNFFFSIPSPRLHLAYFDVNLVRFFSEMFGEGIC